MIYFLIAKRVCKNFFLKGEGGFWAQWRLPTSYMVCRHCWCGVAGRLSIQILILMIEVMRNPLKVPTTFFNSTHNFLLIQKHFLYFRVKTFPGRSSGWQKDGGWYSAGEQKHSHKTQNINIIFPPAEHKTSSSDSPQNYSVPYKEKKPSQVTATEVFAIHRYSYLSYYLY